MIAFAELPKVAYDEMNTVHAEEVEQLNHIETLLDTGAPETALAQALEALFFHTREHFANEEYLMREVGFPAFEMHKAEHDRALNAFQLVMMEWRNRNDDEIIRDYICTDTPQWLQQHIATMDTVTANFIAMVKGS
ncbi:hemerythrin family protein [Sulfurimonas sp. HSL-3221]|uniref:bacteriohemerythrin n=1 Tax=Sulfurimonadaceae TaxID=2771471 RepID=UPI001E434DD4|nr:hemerythrin family protein [Sulfurimonas sp. HSL-3221]UFS63671.1 hemerythrin family protein [Sulfurimonas sp. HSL-3221]